MRLIGHLENETAARRFGDFLYVHGLVNTVEADQGRWAIWIHDDDHLREAGQRLEEFRANPTGKEFAVTETAEEKREHEKQDLKKHQKRMHSRSEMLRKLSSSGMGKVTILLMAISIGVAIFSSLGNRPDRIMGLFITKWNMDGMYVAWEKGLPEIRHGEIWRLITPIFIHFGPMHIIFNMLWLRDLGSMVESRENSWRLLFLVLLTAAGSNLAQFFISIPGFPALGGGSPNFGGMSGVVYGLLGYIWIRGKLDPASGFFLHKSTVMMMLIWLVLCFTGILGSIANLVHLFGLLIGMGAGFFFSQLRSK